MLRTSQQPQSSNLFLGLPPPPPKAAAGHAPVQLVSNMTVSQYTQQQLLDQGIRPEGCVCVCAQQVKPCAEQADTGQWQLVTHHTSAHAMTLTHKRRPGHVIHLLASSAEGPSQVLFTPAAPPSQC